MPLAPAREASSPAELMEQGRAALAAGEPLEAANCFAIAGQTATADSECRYWLASALFAAGETEAARHYLGEAVTLHSVQVVRNLGADAQRMAKDRAYAAAIAWQLYAAQHMGPASLAFGHALDFDHLDAQLFLTYGLSLQHQGRPEEAAQVFLGAVEAFRKPAVHEFLLFALFFVGDGVRRYAEEARRWTAAYMSGLARRDSWDNDRNPDRRLRIGYVGPSFTRSQLRQFVMPVLENHDPAAVEVFIYCADPSAEEALPAHATVLGVKGLDDAALAERIRGDRIDILVDLWGHTAGSRLGVFARKPAPVQVAWVNFVQTTGLDAMDYVLHCDSMDTPGTDALFTETIWRTGLIMAPFRPAADRPPPAPTPALSKGRITFGSFNNPVKLSDATVAGWARILNGRPGSTLLLKYGPYADPVLQRAVRARFAAHGVAAERLEFQGHSQGADYLRAFQDIDLALDPSPCPGGTTTCDALANGVPVLTLKGDDFYARIGLNAVLACGLPELIAESWDDYVAKALALTEDVAALDALRARVRPGFEASAFRDEAGFTRRLEADFRRMFEIWLER